jgi:hypothetical protein
MSLDARGLIGRMDTTADMDVGPSGGLRV